MARVFLSCVSGEFKAYRELLAQQLEAAGVSVFSQEKAADSSRPILEQLDEWVSGCDVVVHLVGLGTGFKPKPGKDGRPSEVDEFLARRDRPAFLQSSGLEPHAAALSAVSYTQWEYWLARHHRKRCLIYKVDPAAEREADFRRTDAEAGEQAAHLDRIRDLYESRASVSGAWHLATRVMVSLIHGGTLAVPDEVGQPAIVAGFRPGTAGDYLSSGAIRWRGRTVPLARPVSLPPGKGWGKAVCGRLTELIERGNRAFAHENIGVGKVVVELVLPEELLTRPLAEWEFVDPQTRRPRAVGQSHPVRVRLAGRGEGHTAVQNIRARLALLRKHQQRVEKVFRQVPPEYRTSASALPLAVVHESGEGCWHPTAVVCGGFAAPPPKLPTRRASRSPKKVVESEQFKAVFEGVPFLVWPDSAVEHPLPLLDQLEEAITAMPRPAELCEYLERRPFVVFAESRDPPFPDEPEMRSDVSSPGAAP